MLFISKMLSLNDRNKFLYKEHMTHARFVYLGACLSEMSQYLQVVDLTSFLLIVRRDIGDSNKICIFVILLVVPYN